MRNTRGSGRGLHFIDRWMLLGCWGRSNSIAECVYRLYAAWPCFVSRSCFLPCLLCKLNESRKCVTAVTVVTVVIMATVTMVTAVTVAIITVVTMVTSVTMIAVATVTMATAVTVVTVVLWGYASP